MKRLLIVSNPYATTVSARLKRLVVFALKSRYEVDALDTEQRNHASELGSYAAKEGYDAVVAFGGDGTANEIANGLANSEIPLACLPGGSANIYCKMLGIPDDIVDATEHLIALADRWQPRSVDLAMVNNRYFLFAAGVGLDASVVAYVDANPSLKQQLRQGYFLYAGVRSFMQNRGEEAPRLCVQTDRTTVYGTTAIVQNCRPFTYLGQTPVEICTEVALNSGDISAAILKRTRFRDIPDLIWNTFRPDRYMSDARHIRTVEHINSVVIKSSDERSYPLQVDGDYIGDIQSAEFTAAPNALRVVA